MSDNNPWAGNRLKALSSKHDRYLTICVLVYLRIVGYNGHLI